MSDQTKLHVAIDNAGKAQRELAKTAEAFAALKAAYLDAWEKTAVREQDARERLWQAVQIVGKVEQHLKTLVEGGKLARKELDRIEKLGAKRFGVI